MLNKVERSTLLPICYRFNKVDRVEFNFVACVYRTLEISTDLNLKISDNIADGMINMQVPVHIWK